MKTQIWIDGTAFVGGLAIAAAIWAGVHDLGGGWPGVDKQFIQAANVTLSDGGQAGGQRKNGDAGDDPSMHSAERPSGRPNGQPGGESAAGDLNGQTGGDLAGGGLSGQQGGYSAKGKLIGQPGGNSLEEPGGQPGGDRASRSTGQSVGGASRLSGKTYDWTAAVEAVPRPDRPISSLTESHQADPPTKHPDRSSIKPSAAAPKLSVRVYLTDSRRVERVALEQYVRGVLAAEMPTDFEPAALQAQALAARTYIVRRLLHEDRSGVPTEKADVTDTQTHQVYRSKAEMDKLRKNDEKAWQAVDKAVSSTQGLVITYDGEPIDALYFSSSNGYTENSEDVFGFALPYLRSVDSPWDRENAPRSTESVTLPLDQFYDKLGIRDLPAVGQQEKAAPAIKVQSRTAGKRIRTLSVGGATLSGVQARDKLGLRSADFSWQISEDAITLTTRGSGHGVGMSQWGAQGMALAGYTADRIISHYYSGAELMEVSRFL